MRKSLLFRHWLLAIVAVLAGSFAANATDLGALELGVEYSVESFSSLEATYTPATSGPVKLICYCDPIEVYTSADHADSSLIEGEWDNSYWPKGYTYNLEAGVTYYLYYGFFWDAGTFTLEAAADMGIGLKSTMPDAGTVYSPSTTDMVSFKFDCDVKYTEAKIVVGATEYAVTHYYQSGGYINVQASKKLVELVNNGDINVGDTFKVRVTGICKESDVSVIYSTDGVAEAEYTLGAMPTTLASANLTLYDSTLGENQTQNPFNSYYRAGDNAAEITLTFSGAIQTDCTPVATFSIGDPAYESKFYTDAVNGVIDGNTVTFDMSGVTRHWKKWPSGLAETTDPASIKFTGIIDVNGSPVYSGDPASPNSFSAIMQMNYLEYPVSGEFTPATGTDVADGTEISIAVANGQHITYDNVKIDYTKDDVATSVEIPAGEITTVNGDDSAATLTFALPAIGADAGTAVNVSLTNVLCDDGFSYDVAGTYNVAVPAECTVTLVNPADDSTWADIKDAGYFKVYVENAPAADELEVLIRFYAPNEVYPQITTYAVAATPEDGESLVYNYTQEVFESYDMIQGVDYTVNVTVTAVTYPEGGGRSTEEVASSDITLHGSGTPYVYSDAKLTRITPNPVTTDIISTDQNLITLVFDKPVVVTKAGKPLGFGGGVTSWEVAKYEDSTILDENFEEVEIEDGSVWTVTIPKATILASKSTIPVALYVQDTEGHPVYQTTVTGINEPTQNKENTYFSFDYTCTVGAPDFTVEPYDPDGDGFTVVTQLDKIYVSFSTGIDPNWNQSDPIHLYKGKGTYQTLVKEWAPDYFDLSNEDVCVEYDEVNLKWCLNLDEPVTEPGAYFLVFPNAFFNLGSEFDQSFSRLTNVKFLINEPVVLDNITADPAVGSTVKSLKTIKITWVDAADAGVDWNVTEPINVYDEGGNVVTTGSLDMSDDWDDPYNMLILTLKAEITTIGTYTIHIPTGKVLLNDGNKSSSEQNLLYTVSNASGITDILTDGIVDSDVYSVSGIRVLKAGESTTKLAKGVYIINGRKMIK